jgi:2-dehydro-3-deoxyphosphooctonate aldolase (KDO 8-P synthase)
VMTLPPVESVEVADGHVLIGGARPRLALIAGPCLIEELAATREMALQIAEVADRLDLPFIFKASLDKANRTSVSSARGFGWAAGLEILARVKAETGLPMLSDVHETQQVDWAAAVLDIIQIPAFLSRQTDLLVAAGETGKPVNIKKGQFLSPVDIQHSIGKVLSTGNRGIMVTERGTTFGYNNLVVDIRGLPIMRGLGFPVVFDGTHSVQLPGGADGASGGQREFVAPLVRAAVAAGVDALFLEVHPDPDNAPCDGPNMVPLSELEPLLRAALRIFEAAWSSDDDGV